MDPTTITSLLHVAAIPHPGRGHVNPMLNLCRSLLLLSNNNPNGHNLLVSFIVTEEWAHLITSSSASPLPPALRLVTIPNVIPSERTRGASFAEFFRSVMTDMAGPVEAALADPYRPAVDLVVADAILPWAPAICLRRGLPVAALWTQSAAVLLALERFGQSAVECSPPGKDYEALAYLPRVASPHLADMLSDTTEHIVIRRFLQHFSWFTTAQSLLLSSSYELESHVIDILKSDHSVPIYAIGPSIPYMTLPDPPVEPESDRSYFKWLDSQPNGSVLYISLGSFLSASSEQVDEIVMGLNASGVRYIWVARNKEQLKVLDGELGMVVPWCDQLRVLCHPSVGGFLTHCGWNSTMEGAYAGVPMLTYPLIWDQYPNSKQIVDDWKIGLRLKDEEVERVIGREEVAGKVLEVMDSEESKRMRTRVAELKEKCRQATGEGGSSSTSLDTFVRAMTGKKAKY